jgi:hypothetical protein
MSPACAAIAWCRWSTAIGRIRFIALGKLQSVRIEAGALHGRVKFNQTREGDRAAALIAAGSAPISLAYGIEDMEIFDRNHARLSGSNLDRLG